MKNTRIIIVESSVHLLTVAFARAITERTEEVMKETAGKEDDKIYRGINNYAKYIDKKESLIGKHSK